MNHVNTNTEKQCWNKLPVDFINRLTEIIPENNLPSVLQSFCIKKPISIRINTLKITKKEVISVLNNAGIESIEIPWYSDACILSSVSRQTILELPIYTNGQIYIQNLSSMIPALVLNPLQDEKILDLCAAPGSKTTQIAQIMKNTGEILANDNSRQRSYRMQSIIASQNVTNTKMLISRGEHLWKKYPNYFDKVLVDVPCTMEGRFNANDPESYRDWTIKKVHMLANLQRQLLRSAYYSVKPGGTIVYSTCTLEPEENEAVIQGLIDQEKEYVRLEEINIPKLRISESIKKWKNQTFIKDMEKVIRIYPDEIMEGFFVAKLTRLN